MNRRNLFFYLIIILVVALSIYLLWFIKTESYACINSPLVYGAGKLTSTDDKPISCSCSMEGSSTILLFDKNGMKIREGMDFDFQNSSYFN